MVVAWASVTLPTVVAQALAAISLGLLAASGVAKLVDPAPTTGAMQSAGLPASRPITHALGLFEVVIAGAALAIGGPYLILAALSYLAFGLFTFGALRQRIPVQSCGCFGREDTPPSVVHVTYNVVAAVAIAATAGLGVSPVDWSMATLELVLYLGYTALGTVASYLLLTRLPQLLAVGRATQ